MIFRPPLSSHPRLWKQVEAESLCQVSSVLLRWGMEPWNLDPSAHFQLRWGCWGVTLWICLHWNPFILFSYPFPDLRWMQIEVLGNHTGSGVAWGERGSESRSGQAWPPSPNTHYITFVVLCPGVYSVSSLQFCKKCYNVRRDGSYTYLWLRIHRHIYDKLFIYILWFIFALIHDMVCSPPPLLHKSLKWKWQWIGLLIPHEEKDF